VMLLDGMASLSGMPVSSALPGLFILYILSLLQSICEGNLTYNNNIQLAVPVPPCESIPEQPPVTTTKALVVK